MAMQLLPPRSMSSTLTPPLRKAGSVRESGETAALAKRRSRLQELRAASSSQASEAAIAFGVGKRDSKRRHGASADASSGSGSSKSSTAAAMRKSQSLDAAESYSLASIQSPLWVTLTNARTIEELAQQKL
ncbi:hypothetical protein AWZ03_010906 [Drosophila navojoa]|uniref:Uncharacterized protein n=1 Tax=Drosophila navojoa TaxID=7232 RepID=A0A484B1L5_DRONA|nr:uncharacterized protein LOC115563936 [Drosophila navojoa]TDG42686.1 hypothetical protein AWZ03_010906 [Drosophila navojoa]